MMQMNIPNNFNNFIGNNNLINQFQNIPLNPINANINQNQVNKGSKSVPRPGKNLPIINKPFANGLQNIGATCYMNATIQCLAHVEDFTKGLLRKKNEIKYNKYKNKLANAFLEVIENLWENKTIKNYTPKNFKSFIEKNGVSLIENNENNQKEFINYLIEGLHMELNNNKNVKKYKNDKGNIYNIHKCIESYDKYFKHKIESSNDANEYS